MIFMFGVQKSEMRKMTSIIDQLDNGNYTTKFEKGLMNTCTPKRETGLSYFVIDLHLVYFYNNPNI